MIGDDTKLWKGIHCSQECHLLQQDLNSISTWADFGQMELNPDKTKVISIVSSHRAFEYTLQGNIVERVIT